MIDELERVVALLAPLPEKYQKEAARTLAWFLRRVDEEMTMTEDEIAALRRLERERSLDLRRQIQEFLDLPVKKSPDNGSG